MPDWFVLEKIGPGLVFSPVGDGYRRPGIEYERVTTSLHLDNYVIHVCEFHNHNATSFKIFLFPQRQDINNYNS